MSDPTNENLNGSLPEGAEVWSKYKDVLNQASHDTEGLEGKLKSLGSVVRTMGPQFAELGEAIEAGINPAVLVTMAAVAGMDKVFEHAQKLQDQFRSLIEEGQRINGLIQNLIHARPTETDSRLELTDQLARLHERPDRSWVTEEQNIAAVRERDQTKLDEAPADQKPALKRILITDEIAETTGALQKDILKGTDVDAAQKKANQTRDTEDDLKRQIRELPGIIAALKQNAANAKAAGDSTGWIVAYQDYKLQGGQQDQARWLQAQLDQANSKFPGAATAAADAENDLKNTQQNNERIQDLKERLDAPHSRLATFDKSTDGIKLTQKIQGIIDQNQGTGNSIREMSDKLHYSQQQIIDLATRIITQQKTTQNTINILHQQLDDQARQIAAMPNSNR